MDRTLTIAGLVLLFVLVCGSLGIALIVAVFMAMGGEKPQPVEQVKQFSLPIGSDEIPQGIAVKPHSVVRDVAGKFRIVSGDGSRLLIREFDTQEEAEACARELQALPEQNTFEVVSEAKE